MNHAVALSMAFGPQAGLDLVDALTSVPALKGYHWLPSVRGDLLARLGRIEERPGSNSKGRQRSLTVHLSSPCCASGQQPASAPRTGCELTRTSTPVGFAV